MQSLYAALSVSIITLVLSENPVVIASIGATVFMVFALPNNISAEPKRIIGGHFLGFFIVSCFAVFPFMHILLFKAIWFALSIGFAILLVVVLAFEHPPSAGTAIDAIIFPIIVPILNPILVFLIIGETLGPWAIIGGFMALGSLTLRVTLQQNRQTN